MVDNIRSPQPHKVPLCHHPSAEIGFLELMHEEIAVLAHLEKYVSPDGVGRADVHRGDENTLVPWCPLTHQGRDAHVDEWDRDSADARVVKLAERLRDDQRRREDSVVVDREDDRRARK